MSRLLVLILAALPLAGGEALRIAAVERQGWPPYEDARRIYRIEGDAVGSLRVGDRLKLQRPDYPGDPGLLKVAAVSQGFAQATLERRGSGYPLKGDYAEPARARPLPLIPGLLDMEDLRPAQPRLQPPPEAPPPPAPGPPAQHRAKELPQAPVHGDPPPAPHAAPPRGMEPIFFLEGDGALSPKGVEKLRRMVDQWGAEGAWSLGVPEDRALPPKVREARVLALRRALKGLGIPRVAVQSADLRPGDRGDVVYATCR